MYTAQQIQSFQWRVPALPTKIGEVIEVELPCYADHTHARIECVGRNGARVMLYRVTFHNQ